MINQNIYSLLRYDFKPELYSSKIYKKNPILDDSIEYLYSILDNVENFYQQENFQEAFKESIKLIELIKNKTFLDSFIYEDYSDDDRFKKWNQNTKELSYSLTKDDFEVFLNKVKKRDLTSNLIYEEITIFLIKTLLKLELYDNAIDVFKMMKSSWYLTSDYNRLFLWSYTLYKALNYIESLKCSQKCLKICLENEKNIENLYASHILIFFNLFKLKNYTSAIYILTEFEDKFKINQYEHLFWTHMKKCLKMVYLSIGDNKYKEIQFQIDAYNYDSSDVSSDSILSSLIK